MSTHAQQVNTNTIGVGLIGASPINPGWGVFAHIPALQALPDDYELRAVSTSNRQSAEAASQAFGVPAFDNHHDLINHPGVDLVVVTVKVKYHHELVSAALSAGKMVFSEWPLGNDLNEALDLTARAKAAGVRTAIGLQARFAPAIQHARDLIADGYIGEVLATTLTGTGMLWGPVTSRNFAYIYDITQGATLLAVPTLHALDALTYVLGDFDSVAAKLEIRQSAVRIVEDDTTLPVTAPDHLAIIGTLSSGAVASAFYRSGSSRGDNLRWEIIGTQGELVLSASTNGNLQVTELKLEGGKGDDQTLSEIVIPDQYFENILNVPAGPPSNVGQLYASFAKDIREGTQVTPDFAHAVKRHRLHDAIVTASRTGLAQKIDNSNS